MINWGPVGGRNTHKEKKKRRGNQTPGSAKGEACQASPLDRFMAKYSRAHKHPGYHDWCLKKNGQNHVK